MSSFISYISSFDSSILYAVQSIGPKWLSVAKFLSYGVGSYVIMLAVFFVALLIIERWRVVGELLIIAILSFCALALLKHTFGIDRPYMSDFGIIRYGDETSFSLPSGHALMSVVILGWVALRHPKSHTLVWGALVIIVLIGLSRIYLGAHYPSQVIAGWIFGGLFLYIFHLIDKRLWAPFQKKLR